MKRATTISNTRIIYSSVLKLSLIDYEYLHNIYTLFLIACACFQICYNVNVFNMFLRLISTFQKTSLSCQHLSILNLYLIYSQYHIVNSRFSEIFPYLYSSYIQLSSIKKNNKSKEKKTNKN